MLFLFFLIVMGGVVGLFLVGVGRDGGFSNSCLGLFGVSYLLLLLFFKGEVFGSYFGDRNFLGIRLVIFVGRFF